MKWLRVYFRVCILVSFMLILGKSNVKAQELSKDQIEHKALNSFDQGNYKDAIPGLKQLLEIYPKEEAYNYYLGRCYLHANISLDQSIQYLRYAASRNYSTDVHYYLAEAYYKNYLLEDAEISLLNFLNIAKRKQIKQLEPDKLKASIKQLRQEAFMVPKVNVVANESLRLREISNVYALHLKGKIMPKDVSFMLKYDKETQYQGYMYVPDTSENGYKLYFPVRDRKGLDIYETTQITSQNYSLPKELSAINTEYNEEYPYYDVNNQVLYFSSNRLGGLGGYDIYKSEFDQETEMFSDPVRLEFPINSPFDDILFVPSETGDNAIFLSNREGVIVEYIAYKMELADEMGYSFPKTIDDIREIASLPLKVEDSQNPILVENLSPSVSPRIIPPYEMILREAMKEQLTCDSIKAELVLQKNALRAEKDENGRRILFSKIAELEKNLTKYQSEADNLFAKALSVQEPEQKIAPNEMLSESEISPARNESTENLHIKVNKEVSGIKQFSFTDQSKIEGATISTEKEREAYAIATNSFTILEQSAYSTENPIPFEVDLPDGLAFRIQLGAFSQYLPMDTFGGLTPLNAETVDGRNLIKYYVGVFGSSKAAREALFQVKDYGYVDAFIVPYFDKQKISIQKARELEFGEKNTLGRR